jgi:hypothetical protein
VSIVLLAAKVVNLPQANALPPWHKGQQVPGQRSPPLTQFALRTIGAPDDTEGFQDEDNQMDG